MARRRGWNEALHPRDARGRFADTPGEGWLSAITADTNPRVLKKAQPTIPEPSGEGRRIVKRSPFKVKPGDHVRGEDGRWFAVDSTHQDPATGTVKFHSFTYGVKDITVLGHQPIEVRTRNNEAGVRFDSPWLKAPTGEDAKWMNRRRRDALKNVWTSPPRPTNREVRMAEAQKEIADAQKGLLKLRESERQRLLQIRPSLAKRTDELEREIDYIIGSPNSWAERDLRLAQQEFEHLRTNNDAFWDLPSPYGKVDPPRFTGKVVPSRPLAVYGDMLVPGGGMGVVRHARQLEKAPASHHMLLAGEMARARQTNPQHGGIWLSIRGAADMNHSQDLADQEPRGWGAGRTWKEVNGAYRWDRAVMLVGHTANAETAGDSAALHELGHMMDDLLSRRLKRDGQGKRGGFISGSMSDQGDWRNVYDRAKRSAGKGISPYFLQAGDAGPQEMWAEAYEVWAEEHQKFLQTQKERKKFKLVPLPATMEVDAIGLGMISRFDLTQMAAQEMARYFDGVHRTIEGLSGL